MKTTIENPDRLASSIVAFCRFARANGMAVGMQQTLAALEAVNAVGMADWERFSFALRASLCSSHEEWVDFGAIFDEFWRERNERDRETSRPARDRTATKARGSSQLLAGPDVQASSFAEAAGKLVTGASSQQRLKKMDFSQASTGDLAELEQLALRLSRQMSARLARRLRAEERGQRVDLRRSIRRNITRGGDPVVLAYKDRRPQKKRLVIFLDISGSMNLYSLFLLRFAYALQKHFRRVNTFLFSTGVVEVSDLLRARRLSDALDGVSQRAPEWSGGTRIGGSLREFNRRAGRRMLSRNTFFIVLSDGWDTGAPELLAAELRSTRRRVRKLLWLNPLLGLRDYKPITRGMSVALPHVDVFAPAHNLESLLALERYL